MSFFGKRGDKEVLLWIELYKTVKMYNRLIHKKLIVYVHQTHNFIYLQMMIRFDKKLVREELKNGFASTNSPT